MPPIRKICSRSLLLTLFLVCGICPAVLAQHKWDVDFKTQALFTDQGDLPFWFHSNRFGIIDPNGSNGVMSLDIESRLDPDPLFDYGIGIEPVGRLSPDSRVFFNQLYIDARLGFLNIYAGKKEWRDGLWDSPMSLGSMIWSGNAATMPKVMLYTPKFVGVPGTHHFLSFKAYLGHGWFEKDRYVKNAFLHEKALYIRLMPDDFFAKGYVGAIHDVQWGGRHPTLGKLPQGLSDFGKIFWGNAGESNSPGGEVVNALGNTVGAYVAMLELNFKPMDIKAYRQFYIETSVSTRFRSAWDGLWGLQLDLKGEHSGLLDQLVYEHVNIKKQNPMPGEEIGADQYYDNFLYKDGWTYKGRIIGLPLVTLGQFEGRRDIVNNIIIAHHIGLRGSFPIIVSNHRLPYRLLLTYSRNYGRTTNCRNDFCDEDAENPLRTSRRDQWYGEFRWGVTVNSALRFWNGIGADTGELSDELGIYVGMTYSILSSE